MRHRQSKGENEAVDQKREREHAVCQFVRSDHDATHAKPSKESEDGSMVLRTIPRARLWEVHTPQVIKIDTLQRGFAKVEAENLEVTDDVSIVEQLGEPVKLTLGEYTNLKITTPEDMNLAISILDERKIQPVDLLD